MATGNSPFEDLFFDTIVSIKNNFKSPELYKNYKNIITYNSTTCIEAMLSDFKILSPNFVDPNNILNK